MKREQPNRRIELVREEGRSNSEMFWREKPRGRALGWALLILVLGASLLVAFVLGFAVVYAYLL